jgi:hypothetical protein
MKSALNKAYFKYKNQRKQTLFCIKKRLFCIKKAQKYRLEPRFLSKLISVRPRVIPVTRRIIG